MENELDLSRVKVLLIDIGGVLLTNGWPGESRAGAARQFGFDAAEMERRHDLAFGIYEQGSMSFDQYLDFILFYEARSFSKADFTRFIFDQSRVFEGLLEWLIEWRQSRPKLRVFSLNNEPKELHQYRVEKFGLRRLFDGFVASCDVGLRKPDPAIYRVATGVAGVAPDECLYIDDRLALVEAGRLAGLIGWQHTNFEKTVAMLEQLK